MYKAALFGLFMLAIPICSAAIVINEIYPSPSSSGNTGLAGEWVELHNTGSEAVNLTNWRVYDSKFKEDPEDTTWWKITSKSVHGGNTTILPNGYLVVLKQKSYFCLDNGGDSAILRDWNKTTVDDVTYANTPERKKLVAARRFLGSN